MQTPPSKEVLDHEIESDERASMKAITHAICAAAFWAVVIIIALVILL